MAKPEKSEKTLASFGKRAFERWLEHGWSPPKIASYVIAGVTTGAPVIGYIVQSGSPGAAWWLVWALAIACFWLATEALRWRIREGRLPTAKAHASIQASLGREQAAHLATKKELEALQAISQEAVRFHFWFDSLKIDLNQVPGGADETRVAQCWFHFKSTAEVPLAYRLVDGYVRMGDVTSSIPSSPDAALTQIPSRGDQDYGWFPMPDITRERIGDVEVHLVVHYGRPNGGPWFKMDCLIEPRPSAWWGGDSSWPSVWTWGKKREITHEPVA